MSSGSESEDINPFFRRRERSALFERESNPNYRSRSVSPGRGATSTYIPQFRGRSISPQRYTHQSSSSASPERCTRATCRLPLPDGISLSGQSELDIDPDVPLELRNLLYRPIESKTQHKYII